MNPTYNLVLSGKITLCAFERVTLHDFQIHQIKQNIADMDNRFVKFNTIRYKVVKRKLSLIFLYILGL